MAVGWMYPLSDSPLSVYLDSGRSVNSGEMPPGGEYVVPCEGAMVWIRSSNALDSASSRFDVENFLSCGLDFGLPREGLRPPKFGRLCM
jgi:hypothetical protein